MASLNIACHGRFAKRVGLGDRAAQHLGIERERPAQLLLKLRYACMVRLLPWGLMEAQGTPAMHDAPRRAD